MPPPIRILVADHQAEMQSFYRTMLPKMGHQVAGVVDTGKALVEQCLVLRPDLVIADFRLHDMDSIDAVEEVNRTFRVPVIILTASHRPSQIQRAIDDHVMAYLLKPAGRAELEAEIPLVVRRFQEMEALRRKAEGYVQQ